MIRRVPMLAASLMLQMSSLHTHAANTRTPDDRPATSPVTAALPPGAQLPDPDEPLFAAPTKRDRIGRIMAPVMINGEGPYRFVVDTGATHSVLSGRLVAALGLGDIGPPVPVELSGVTGTMKVDSVAVDRLQAGDLVLEHRRLPVINAVLAGADGVLGVEGLEDKRIVIDFRRDRIRILKSTRAAPSGYLVVPVQLGFNRLLLADAYVGRVRVKAIIDTGAERTLGNVALRDALQLGVDPRRRPLSTNVEGVTADMQSGDIVHTPPITLGETTIRQIAVTFGDLHVFEVWNLRNDPALLLGMDALGTLSALVIDYRRKELQLQPYRMPLSVRYVNGRLSSPANPK